MKAYVNFMSNAVLAMMVICALLLPWNFLVPQCGTFLVFFWLIGFNWKEKWENICKSPLVWIWIAFCILYVTGYFWSANKSEAAISLAVKLGLFIFPPVFASMRLDAKQTKWIFGAYIIGLTSVGLFMLVRAMLLYSKDGVNHFSYQDFSEHIMHPSYISLYYVVGVMLLFHGVLLHKFSIRSKIISIGLVLFFSIMVFMLASKTGIISLVFAFLFYIGYAIVRFRRYAVAGGALVALVAGFFIAVNVFPVLAERLKEMTEVISSSAPIDPKDTESNRVRLLIWKVDRELIAQHPFAGVGTGDVQDSLEVKYLEKGMTGAKEKNLNAHSQYFQTGIALGIPGIILLCGIFLCTIIAGIRRRFGFIVLFTLLLMFNFIPESMLQVQTGTLFVGFFYSLVLFAADRSILSPKL